MQSQRSTNNNENLQKLNYVRTECESEAARRHNTLPC